MTTHPHPVMTPGEVAATFAVDPRTVARWAKTGRLPYFRTPGGHRRYRREDVLRFVAETLEVRRA